MSTPKLRDFLTWLLESEDWKSHSSEPELRDRVGLYLYLHRALDRFLLARSQNALSSTPQHGKQVSPITLMAVEILNRGMSYADTLDRNTHLCFCLHAEGLTNIEISALTTITPSLTDAYIKNAKAILLDKIGSKLGSS